MAEKVESGSDPPLSGEPVKVEEPVGDPSSSENRPSSPEPNCAICLSGPKNKSFTDSCFHQFCFTCLLEWSKVKAECPLCKQAFRCIIHNIRSLDDYDKYLVHQTPPAQPALSPNAFAEEITQMFNDQNDRFRYRTTMVHHMPENLHYLFEAIVNDTLRTSLPTGGNLVLPSYRRPPSTRRNAANGTSDFRRNIYRHNLWVRPMPDITGRYRESSPEFYRLNEASTHRLVPWLNRELNVLLQGSEQQERVMALILRTITVHPIRSQEFYHVLFPHLGSLTRHFLHEFYSYAVSQYDLIGYDQQVQYVSYAELGHDPDAGTLDLSDSDSDIEIVEVSNPPRIEDHSYGGAVTTIVDGNDSDCVVVDEITAANRSSNIELIDVSSDSDCDTVVLAVGSSAPNSAPAHGVTSSDDDFHYVDELPQVKNTTIPKLKLSSAAPKLKLRDVRDLCDRANAPSTSAEVTYERDSNSGMLKLKPRVRSNANRLSSNSVDSIFDTVDSGEEWIPYGSRTKKKKKKKSKSCCCEKFKKHWKKEHLASYNSDSETLSDIGNESSSGVSEFVGFPPSVKLHPTRRKDTGIESGSSTSEFAGFSSSTKLHRRRSGSGEKNHCKPSNCCSPKKKHRTKKSSHKMHTCKNCDCGLLSASIMSSSSSSDEDDDINEYSHKQVRSKSKKSVTIDEHFRVTKKSSSSSSCKRKSVYTSSRKVKKSKGSKKHSKSHRSFVSLTDDNSDVEESLEPKATALRSSSIELDQKPILTKIKSQGKNMALLERMLATSSDEEMSVEVADTPPIVKSESVALPATSSDSDLDSNNSNGSRPRLKSVVRVVNSKRRNSDSVPLYEVVSSSLNEFGPGPSTSKSPECSTSLASMKMNSKKKP